MRINAKWEQRKLRKVACINPKTNIPDNFKYVDLESVVGTSLIKAKLTTKQLAPSRAQRVAKKGDIFYQTVRPYQKNNFLFDINNYDFQYVFSTGYAQLRSEINNYFLFSYLQRQRFVNLILRRSTGTSYPAISSKDLSEIKIIFPRNSKEQENIGKIINLIDALITLQQRKLEQLMQLKKAMLQQLFTDKNSKQPILRFKSFSGDWEQHKLKDISIIIAGGDKNKDKLKKIGNYPVIANAVNSDGVVGYYDDSYRIEAPAITVTGRGDIGHATPRYLNFTPVVRLLALKTKHDVLFLANAINKITIFNESTGVPQLTKPQLSKYSVKVTKLNEEKKISKIINTLNKLVTLQQNNLTQLTTLKKYLLQNLFV